MPPADSTTIERLKEFIGEDPLRVVAQRLGMTESAAPLLSVILGGKRNISATRENEVRRKLNLFPRGVTRVADTPTKYLASLIENRNEI